MIRLPWEGWWIWHSPDSWEPGLASHIRAVRPFHRVEEGGTGSSAADLGTSPVRVKSSLRGRVYLATLVALGIVQFRRKAVADFQRFLTSALSGTAKHFTKFITAHHISKTLGIVGVAINHKIKSGLLNSVKMRWKFGKKCGNAAWRCSLFSIVLLMLFMWLLPVTAFFKKYGSSGRKIRIRIKFV